MKSLIYLLLLAVILLQSNASPSQGLLEDFSMEEDHENDDESFIASPSRLVKRISINLGEGNDTIGFNLDNLPVRTQIIIGSVVAVVVLIVLVATGGGALKYFKVNPKKILSRLAKAGTSS